MPWFIAARDGALWFALCLLAAACSPYVVPEGQQQAKPAFTLQGFRTDDGLLLPHLEWGPKQPDAVILALHGFGDYGNAFDKAAQAFAKHGIATFAYDQRGFGVAPNRGYWHGADRLARDAAGAVDALARRYPGAPVYLLGHSMGGAVAMTAAARYPEMQAEGLILIAPAIWSREFLPETHRRLLRASAHTVPWYPLTGQGIRVTPTDDSSVLRQLSRDPKVLHAVRVDQIWGLTNLMDRAAAVAGEITLPTLYLYGLKDDVIPRDPTAAIIARFANRGLKVGIYDNGYHLLLRSGKGDAVVADIIHWLDWPSAPLPSSADKDWRQRLQHQPSRPEFAAESVGSRAR